jgi:hypothetical protein
MSRPVITVELIKMATESFCAEHNFNEEMIAEVYFSVYPADGFELALALINECGWDVSREDMETLDQIEYLVRDELKQREKRWAADNNITPPLEIGTMTTLGEITGIYSFGVARYEIKLHDQDDSIRFIRQIVKFEDAIQEDKL